MSGPLNWLRQLAAVTRFSLASIPQRAGAVAAALVGIAGVVAVLVGTLSIAEGFRQALRSSGSPDVALVMRSGSDSEGVSLLTGEEARWIRDAPGLRRMATGPLASAEALVIINLPKRTTGTDANVLLRGVEEAAFQVREEVRIVEGRRFEPGRNEVIIGSGAAAEYAGLDVGGTLRLGRVEWRIVGRFTARGGVAESELWTDAVAVQNAYQRGNTYQSVFARLASPAALDVFQEALSRDPRLNVKVLRQDEYYAEQGRLLSNLITGLGSVIAGLMGLGAVFGALNTMYSAVAARTREIATLRALGFGSGPVVGSVLAESLLMALVGGGLGGGLAYLAFNGYQAATMNWQTFSQVAFAFRVTPALLVQGVLYATVIGLLGGLFPALRAARMPVVAGLREP
ncbi:MAG: ABC transporter permease [Verrucomicrobiales bacterium]|nr:ABC transporter permease [Verrucomicrobiales bacterium]